MLDLEIEVMKISCFCKMEICLCVCDMFVEIVCVARQIVLLSCLCFAKMSIYFCFSEFRANSRSICPIFREVHAEFLYDFDACTHFYNQFVYYITVQS